METYSPNLSARNLSSTIGQLLTDIHLEAAPPKPKPKPKPKNYAKENIKKLKEIQEKCKQKEEEKIKSQLKPRINKYKTVQSKVFTGVDRTFSQPKCTSQQSDKPSNDENNSNNGTTSPEPVTCDSSVSNLLPSCGDSPIPDEIHNENSAVKIEENNLIANEDAKSTDTVQNSIPEETGIEKIQEETGDTRPSSEQRLSAMSLKNNKSANKNRQNSSTYNSSPRSSTRSALRGKETKVHSLGEIPKYLTERQQQWKEEELKRKQEEPDPDVPAGHIVLSDEERLTTLENFKKSKEELLQKLLRIPVCCDTLRSKKQKELVEKELARVDEGIELFSKNRVLIKMDE